jgi:hypothetical protein
LPGIGIKIIANPCPVTPFTFLTNSSNFLSKSKIAISKVI